MGANPWFMPIGRHRYAEHVLFCFHHAGGNAAFYQSWAKGLPESLSLVAIQFPGRSGRLNESPVVSMSAAVSEIASGIPAATLGLPFSFFGHSLGALVAFEVARVYEPRHLFVSGLRAPQIYERTRKQHYADLPVAELLAVLRKQGGTPEEVLSNPELLDLVLPAIRADYRLAGSYQVLPGPKLACPLTVFGGNADSENSPDEMAAWREQTRSSSFQIEIFSGGHFYLVGARDLLLSRIAQALG